tara:strand:+ start:703 stop:930 length:228 start_codon:yes stop_codon:yes gene_type:complete
MSFYILSWLAEDEDGGNKRNFYLYSLIQFGILEIIAQRLEEGICKWSDKTYPSHMTYNIVKGPSWKKVDFEKNKK